MKNLATVFVLTKRGFFVLAACAFVLSVMNHEASAQWKLASGVDPNSNTTADAFIVSGNTITAVVDVPSGTSNYADSIWRSTDNGKTWSSVNAGGGWPFVINGSSMYGVELDTPRYSPDGGITWQVDTAGFPNNPNDPPYNMAKITSMVSAGNSVFVGTDTNGIYKQTSPGSPWATDSAGLRGTVTSSNGSVTGTVGVQSLYVTPDGNTIFASGIGGTFTSSSQGGPWTLSVNGQQQIPLIEPGLLATAYPAAYGFTSIGNATYGIFMDTLAFFAITSWDIYRTTNNGLNWTRTNTMPLKLGGVLMNPRIASAGNELFVGTDSGFWASSDQGATWARFEDGLPPDTAVFGVQRIQTIAVSGDNVVIGTGWGGIYYRALSDFGVSSVAPFASNSSTPLNLTISENPASNSETKIIYTVKDAGPVEVSLLDVLGRSTTLLNGRASAGQNVIPLDPHLLAPGTYFVRVEVGGMSDMKKLVIMQ